MSALQLTWAGIPSQSRSHPNKTPLFWGICMWNLPVLAWRQKLCLKRSPKFGQGSIPIKCSCSREVTWNLPVLAWSRKLCLGCPPNYMLQFSAKVVRFRFITFASCFAMSEGHMWGTFPKCVIGLSYQLIILGPLFWEWPHPGLSTWSPPTFLLSLMISLSFM
jgi:hypothetical protein